MVFSRPFSTTGWFPALLSLLVFAACSKQDTPAPPQPPPPAPPAITDTAGPLKSATSLTMGFAINNTSFFNNSAYRNLVLREVTSVTPENELKYNAIVQNDGSYNFTTADALINNASASGLQVFGHVLAWHSQQNATFLKMYAGLSSASGPELLTNGSFEEGLSNWAILNTNGATISAGSGGADAHEGSGYMKVVNPTAQVNNQWKVQVSSAAFTTVPGKEYVASYWVKAAAPGGSIRLSTGPASAQYQPDQTIGTTYQQVSWLFTASLSSTTLLLDMGQTANTYFIDDVSVREAGAGAAGQVAEKLDVALHNWIDAVVKRYAGKIKAWDVVNEIFADNGNLRNNSNTPAAPDVFVWSHFMGRDFARKAFTYASAADPDALLFINDYNLESSSTAKLDSLIALVKALKAEGLKIDGVGTQMHISVNTSLFNIDRMFQRLASTGLKVRISELDVRVNPSDNQAYVFTAAEAALQATTYKNVVSSYLKNVPLDQQYGITFWGVDDPSSWIVARKKNDYPLLFDKNFAKKPAYTSVILALKQK